MDLWKSVTLDYLLSIFIHWIDEDFNLQMAVAYCGLLEGSHTGQMIADVVIPVLEEWLGTTSPVAAVVDGGSNMIKAVKIIKEKKFVELEVERYEFGVFHFRFPFIIFSFLIVFY